MVFKTNGRLGYLPSLWMDLFPRPAWHSKTAMRNSRVHANKKAQSLKITNKGDQQ